VKVRRHAFSCAAAHYTITTASKYISKSDYRFTAAVLAHTSDWIGLYAQKSRRQQCLDALSRVLDRSLPVFGRAASTDRLELVRGQPCAVEQHSSIARSFLARRSSTEV